MALIIKILALPKVFLTPHKLNFYTKKILLFNLFFYIFVSWNINNIGLWND